MKDSDKEVVANFVKNYFGAASYCLVIADSLMPCPDAMSGAKCTHPHRFQVIVDGMMPLAVIDCVAQCAGKTLKDLADDIHEQENADEE